jgi:hypothetical protein
MLKNIIFTYAAIVLAIVLLIGLTLYFIMGEGALKRHLTISGVYSVCKPDGYDVVCFLDADGKEGGMSCLPLSAAGGKCQ